MGAVYEAIHLELNRPCAIKLLAPEHATSDPQARTRLRQEALTECDFDHPNLVRLFDFGTNVVTIEENGRVRDYDELYIVMELLRGQSLKHLLTPRRPLMPETAITIAAQLADGLAEIHSKRVVHRDLKPENVLLCEDHKGDLLVKIVDFGAVKMLRTSAVAGAIDLTKAMFVGSPVYASPENCKGEPIDERSDIYSLGLIIYEMVAGRRAFEDRGFLTLLNSHAYETPRPLIGIPKALAELTMAALEKDPARRPQTAKEFADNLRDLTLDILQPNKTSGDAQNKSESKEIQGNETVVANRPVEMAPIDKEAIVVKTHSATNAVISDVSIPVQGRIHEFRRVEIPVLPTSSPNRSFNRKQKLAIAVIALAGLSAVSFLSMRRNKSDSSTPAMNAAFLPSPQPSPFVIAKQVQPPVQDATPRPTAREPRPSATPGQIILPKMMFPDYPIKPVSIPRFTPDWPPPKSKPRGKSYSNPLLSEEIQDILRRNGRLLTITKTNNPRPLRNRHEFHFPMIRPTRKHSSVSPRPKTYHFPRRR
jgi:serine/threonine protein kinase